MHHRQGLDEEEAKKKRKEVEEKLKAEEEERRKRDKEKLRKETRSLRDKGERLDKKEQDTKTADELLSEGTRKLQDALSSGSKVDSQGA